MTIAFTDFIEQCRARTAKILTHYLNETPSPSPLLQQAMAYAIFNGGKQIRPLLAYTTGYALGANLEDIDAPACAVEMIHAYSLVHDDLPAMDNADLRRGKPSCHKKFGEAMAILAGDALQTLAIELLATHPANLQPQQRLSMIAILSQASGPQGMAGGQALDISLHDHLDLDEIKQLYRLKTGALLIASIQLGMLSVRVIEPAIQTALENYAVCLGLAYQLQDDLLDIESSTEVIGKPQGIDVANKKMTYPVLVGVEETRKKVRDLTDQALDFIQPMGEKAGMLGQLANYLLCRRK
jgi:farnesyl diphosphate synthase